MTVWPLPSVAWSTEIKLEEYPAMVSRWSHVTYMGAGAGLPARAGSAKKVEKLVAVR